MGIEETIRRSKEYIDAGADMIFPEGLASKEEFSHVAEVLKGHKKDVFLLANMTEFGKTPMIKLAEFEQMGYSCVIYPVSTLRIAMLAIDKCLDSLIETGSMEESVPEMYTRKQLYSLLDYTPGQEWYYPTPSQKKE